MVTLSPNGHEIWTRLTFERFPTRCCTCILPPVHILVFYLKFKAVDGPQKKHRQLVALIAEKDTEARRSPAQDPCPLLIRGKKPD
jgi:hypothetical protein